MNQTVGECSIERTSIESNDIEVDKEFEIHVKEDEQTESIDTKDALECKICLTSFSISTELNDHRKTYTEDHFNVRLVINVISQGIN